MDRWNKRNQKYWVHCQLERLCISEMKNTDAAFCFFVQEGISFAKSIKKFTHITHLHIVIQSFPPNC